MYQWCLYICFIRGNIMWATTWPNLQVSVRPSKTQISLGIRPVWSESLLSAWRNLWPLATHCAHSGDSDQTGKMPRLIWVVAWRTLILLVLSCRGSCISVSNRHIAWCIQLFKSKDIVRHLHNKKSLLLSVRYQRDLCKIKICLYLRCNCLCMLRKVF